jgi:hypothetical protein
MRSTDFPFAVTPARYGGGGPVTPGQRPTFEQWLKQYGIRETPDYDYRGAYEAGLQPDPATGHFNDTFKRPNHITYSTESRYSQGENAPPAGRWEGSDETGWTFYASPTNIANAGGVKGLQQYFRKYEKDAKLVLPDARASGGPVMRPFAVTPARYGGGGLIGEDDPRWQAELRRRAKLQQAYGQMFDKPAALGRGVLDALGTAGGYIADRAQHPSAIPGDIKSFGSAMYNAIAEDPSGFAMDALLAPLSGSRDFAAVRQQAAQARAAGDNETAGKLEQAAVLAGLSAIPLAGPVFGRGARAAKGAVKDAMAVVRRGRPARGAAAPVETVAAKVLPLPAPEARLALPAPQLAVPVRGAAAPAETMAAKVLPLPAPEARLALPAPGPGLPPHAAKPRGGQFWADKEVGGSNMSPEAAARQGALGLELTHWQPDDGYGVIQIGPRPGDVETTETAAQKWLERALTKYYKNEFGAPDDPLRSLAERGLHYDPDMTPEKWQATVNSHLMEDPVEHILFPPNPKGGMRGAGSDLRGEAMVAMPWLAKLPVTDKIYGIGNGGLDLSHFADEFVNALNPERSGLPMDLAVRPESLDRMTFPQAVERVGKINQFRAKEMERAALSKLNSPAVQTFKEYSENNPMGLRWVELALPRFEGDQLPEGFEVRHLNSGDQNWWAAMDLRKPDELGRDIEIDVLDTPEAARKAIAAYYGRDPLQAALKYEGDTMGHCVGGYCPDVMEGRSRIFSLRDAKGEPHVTVETRSGDPSDIYKQAILDLRDTEYWPAWLENQRNNADRWTTKTDDLVGYMNKFRASQGLEPIDVDIPDEIIQIKGKQNRAPKDDYLPFVQDFVKSGQWRNVGDLANAGLVKLPDGRYITQQQMKEGMDRARAGLPEGTDPRSMLTFNWRGLSPFFEGYAIGGRVSADRCFSCNPMSVKKARGGGLAVKKGR